MGKTNFNVPVSIQINVQSGDSTTCKIETRRFGLLADNRKIDLKKVDRFVSKIEENRYYSRYPIFCYEATNMAAIDQNITDLNGEQIPSDMLAEYLILSDGQHRVAAFIAYNDQRPDDTQVIPNVNIINAESVDDVLQFLVAVNTAGSDWTVAERWQIARNLRNKFADKVIGLINDYNFSSSTASIVYLGKRINKKQFDDILHGNLSALENLDEERIEVGDKFLEIGYEVLGEGFEKLLKKHHYIDGLDEYCKGKSYEAGFERMKKISPDDYRKVRSKDDFRDLLKKAK